MENTFCLKNGEKIIIRYPRIEDAAGLLTMLQNSVATTDYLLLTPEEANMTLEQEIAWLTDVLSDNNKMMLTAVHDNKVIGNVDLTIGPIIKRRHWATLGITIVKEWRGLGLGNILMNTLIDLAKENKEIEIIGLDVFADNHHAISLYEKLGFKKEARIKNSFKLSDNTYIDNIIMTLKIK